MFWPCLSEIRSNNSAWWPFKLPRNCFTWREPIVMTAILDQLRRLRPRIIQSVIATAGRVIQQSALTLLPASLVKVELAQTALRPHTWHLTSDRNSALFDQRKPISNLTLKIQRRCDWDFQGLRCFRGASQSGSKTSRVVADRHCQSRRSLLIEQPTEELCDSL